MYPLARFLLFRLTAEQAHHLVLDQLAKHPALAKLAASHWLPSPRLAQEVLGLSFAHPIGLAAGLDKDAIAVDGLFQCGFSFLEVGTVTPLPQPGNEKPRLFRLKSDEALINRMGFNNQGAANLANRLRANQVRRGPIGVNIGKNKITPNDEAISDYVKALKAVADVADYIAVNISSPNTPGLRDLQSVSFLLDLLAAIEPVRASHNLPVFVKISPDLADESVIAIGQALASSPYASNLGLIATNTTIERTGLRSKERSEGGGLSGKPLADRSTAVVRLLAGAVARKLPIIGCGGVFTAADAYAKIRAGASLVQIYTSFIYRGPQVVREIAEGLDKLLEADGFQHIQEAIGADL
ncbi:dihydroorotate dehydrogenase (quinone) [Alicyclobacillus hesperidum subsp. aegles]|uniref:quinone-dependent dihydroorotate dehydrogenase n=1 Tax=Alicyclobacillus hesperidum TaxID=89784 RepID=UPI002228FAEE|nr:quinone-dependent dihydroorotate dehydrogenase [Alicyclobacillus hesperidum]GLG00026.1 dihydroorotate dehydrogenase (quinone) [Alicyclobacillus hesperidum subsp. aegles]